MQQHDDEREQLSVDLNRMLRALPRERHPDAALEETVAQLLSSRGLLATGQPRARTRQARGRVVITWPAAAAAALVLFASGVMVGAGGGRDRAQDYSAPHVASAPSADAAVQRAGDLLLASDKRKLVTTAIKF